MKRSKIMLLLCFALAATCVEAAGTSCGQSTKSDVQFSTGATGPDACQLRIEAITPTALVMAECYNIEQELPSERPALAVKECQCPAGNDATSYRDIWPDPGSKIYSRRCCPTV